MIDRYCPQFLVTIVVEQCHGLQFYTRVIVTVFLHVGDDEPPSENRQYLQLILVNEKDEQLIGC